MDIEIIDPAASVLTVRFNRCRKRQRTLASRAALQRLQAQSPENFRFAASSRRCRRRIAHTLGDKNTEIEWLTPHDVRAAALLSTQRIGGLPGF
jgi:hypothetical protein